VPALPLGIAGEFRRGAASPRPGPDAPRPRRPRAQILSAPRPFPLV